MDRRRCAEKEAGERAARHLLDSGGLPTAVVAFNDRYAIGVLAALRRSGVSVPGGVSVAGYDDTFSRLSCFSLSTVSQRPEEQARHAVTAAVERLGEGRIEPPRSCSLRASWYATPSTGPPDRTTPGTFIHPRARAAGIDLRGTFPRCRQLAGPPAEQQCRGVVRPQKHQWADHRSTRRSAVGTPLPVPVDPAETTARRSPTPGTERSAGHSRDDHSDGHSDGHNGAAPNPTPRAHRPATRSGYGHRGR
ncbi:substrate-binding domain-containing protein [Streptomyces decoyicus]|uniref:substrate-binding domain-containing protein n=1 Tax=Streptomyces decoyicus TaxID=249567 RepID=UPI0033CF74E7